MGEESDCECESTAKKLFMNQTDQFFVIIHLITIYFREEMNVCTKLNIINPLRIEIVQQK